MPAAPAYYGVVQSCTVQSGLLSPFSTRYARRRPVAGGVALAVMLLGLGVPAVPRALAASAIAMHGAPALPDDIALKTRERYLEALNRLEVPFDIR